MKKLFVVMLSVAFVMTFAVGMVCAKQPWSGPFGNRAVFESDLIDTSENCEVVGEVFVREDGSFKVEFKLPEPVTEDTDFEVTLFCDGSNEFDTIVTVAEGEDEGVELFPAGTVDFDCELPTVVVEEASNGITFVSGFCLGHLGP